MYNCCDMLKGISISSERFSFFLITLLYIVHSSPNHFLYFTNSLMVLNTISISSPGCSKGILSLSELHLKVNKK